MGADAVRRAPGPRGWPVVGVGLQFRRDPLRLLMEAVRRYGDVVQLPLFRLPLTPLEPRQAVYIVNHPAMIRQICLTGRQKYRTHQQLVEKLKLVLGLSDGELLTSVGEEWTRRKATLQPAFTAIAGSNRVVAGMVARMAARWEGLPDGAVIDADIEMTRLVTDLFAAMFLSIDLTGRDAALAGCWQTVLNGFSRRMAMPLQFLLRIPSRANREFRQALEVVEERIYTLLRWREGCGQMPPDLLSEWMAAARAKSSVPGEKAIRDQIMLLLLAGRKNVANALTWACHLLARNPSAADRIRSEPGYAAAVQKEVLRLYPTAWLIARRCLEDDVVGGYRIPRGTTVFISPYAVHRRPDLWPDPERFAPERFAGPIAPDSYLPFGLGPRTCIGNSLTELIMRVTLSMLCARFAFEPVPGHAAAIKASSSLYPAGGMPLVLRKRGTAPLEESDARRTGTCPHPILF